MRDQNGQVGVAEGQVGGGVNRDHPWRRSRGRDIDRANARVREWGPHEDRLERAFVDVIREVAVSTQQPIVLNTLHLLAKPARGHFLESSAARTTARRIEA